MPAVAGVHATTGMPQCAGAVEEGKAVAKPPSNYNSTDSALTFDVSPSVLYEYSQHITAVVDDIVDSWATRIIPSLAGLHLGWAGSTQQEVDGFFRAFDAAQTRLIGSSSGNDTSPAIVDQVRGLAEWAGKAFCAADVAVADTFTRMMWGLQADNSNPPPATQKPDDAVTDPVTETFAQG